MRPLRLRVTPNPEDETTLNDRDKREELMESVGEAIEAYFDKPVQVAAQ